MKVVQTRVQGLIYRLDNLVLSLIGICLVSISMVFFGKDIPQNYIKFYVTGLFIIPIGVTVWLAVFNSGKSKVEEYSFLITEDAIVFRSLLGSDYMPISEYKDYVVKGWWPMTICIIGSESSIEFSQSVFSAKQINKIKNELDRLR
ncbi:hypothetical protein ACJJIG_02480 [Microbulbifer sp. SSSA007]|uniref:hypothetical protein n=1 Tax=Microbulbifer sp. SSSA007 TaxID=3243379 RepID=UPI004039F7B2